MRYTDDQVQKNSRTKRAFGIAIAVLLLAGCSSSGAQEVTRNEAAPEEQTVVTLDFADLTPADTQENLVQENATQETETALPENESQFADQGGEADGIAAKEKEQPPEGFTLRLHSEDWGLSFGEAGAQPVGNALPEELAWYDAYFVGDDSEKVIYLTFDCGYENGNTEPILDA